MQVSKRVGLIVVIVAIGLGYGAAYFIAPEKVTEVVKYKEAKDTVKIVTRIVYKDGTVKEQEVTKDKSVTELDSEKVVTNRNLGVRVKIATKIGESEPIYALGLDSPPLLKLFKTQIGLSASVNTEQEIYGGVYVQF